MKIKKDLWCKKDLEVFFANIDTYLPAIEVLKALLGSGQGTTITTFKRRMDSIKEVLFWTVFQYA